MNEFIVFKSVEVPASVDLSDEGKIDWCHWGLTNTTSWNRKEDGGAHIGNFTIIGSALVRRFTDANIAYSWNNGTPNESASDIICGIYFGHNASGTTGYSLAVDVFTKPHQLKVYLSAWKAESSVKVFFESDPDTVYSDTLPASDGSTYRVFEVVYQGASDDKLIFQMTKFTTWANVTLQAATLQEYVFLPLFSKKQNTLLRR